MARKPDLEPIQINFGEEFKPFEKLKSVYVGEIGDVMAKSGGLYLKNIGAILVEIGLCSWFSDNGVYLIDKKDTLFLGYDLGEVFVNLDPLEPHIKTQPNIICRVQINNAEFWAKNEGISGDMNPQKDGAFFIDFSPIGKHRFRQLVFPTSPSIIRNLIVCFEEK